MSREFRTALEYLAITFGAYLWGLFVLDGSQIEASTFGFAVYTSCVAYVWFAKGRA